MDNLVIITPTLFAKGPLVETEIYASEKIFLEHKNNSSKKKGVKVKMLVDTGSNISGLDRKLIDMLRLPLYQDKASVDGAGGITSLNLYRCILYMDIFQTKALPMDIVEGNFDNSPYHGVIGRDVLRFCNFHFDGPSNCFKISAPGF
jgi:predicted aspartyl protease